ncbi:flagellar hook-length control protein FliK [Herbaspirillum autotrophicum]|uniref:flagellar hook-length control protein FliK n=1 Tax=Herbaspirillum autotrophicum TaxID=180195 RepID=UPI00067DFFF4|nr:flagellar hook-length control protein FliK [Herbaspirillum autotrophicum]
MLPRVDVANIVQPVAAIEAPTATLAVADAKQEAFSRLAQIAIGQQMQGKVLSLFNDGTYLVRIANTAARMVLPTSTRTGDSMLLTLVSKDPRPTFLMGESQPAEEGDTVTLSPGGRQMEKDLQSLRTAQRDMTGTIGKNDALEVVDGKSGQAPANNPQASSTTSLSAAGKLIDTLLQASQHGNVSNAIAGKTPLIPSPAVSTTQLAGALHDGVTLSGVFYESHVAAWSEGKRPVAELLKEPQAQLGPKTGATSDLLTSNDPAHTQLGQIINLQLNALEQHRVTWQGEVWPGQHMEWDISQEHRQENGAQEDETAPTWHSVVRFNFEHLGAVSASIRLVGQQIHMQVSTSNDNAAAALRANGNLLTEAMSAAGTSLDSLIVKQDGEA